MLDLFGFLKIIRHEDSLMETTDVLNYTKGCRVSRFYYK